MRRVLPALRPGLRLRSWAGGRGGRGPVGTPHPTRARDLPGDKKGRGPFKNRARHPLPPSRESDGLRTMGNRWGGQQGGLKGVAWSRSLGAGLKGGLGPGARFPETPRLLRPLLSSLSAPLPRGPLLAEGCRVRGDVPGCAALQARPRAPRGSRHRGGEAGSWIVYASLPGGTALLPQPRPPQSARGPPKGAGGGVPKRPALSPPLLCSASFSGSRFSTAASWAPPGVGGSRCPPSVPFASQAARRGAGLSARLQTTPPTDGRVSLLPAAGIPRVGGGLGSAQGREGGGGGEGGRGGDRSRP